MEFDQWMDEADLPNAVTLVEEFEYETKYRLRESQGIAPNATNKERGRKARKYDLGY